MKGLQCHDTSSKKTTTTIIPKIPKLLTFFDLDGSLFFSAFEKICIFLSVAFHAKKNVRSTFAVFVFLLGLLFSPFLVSSASILVWYFDVVVVLLSFACRLGTQYC